MIMDLKGVIYVRILKELNRLRIITTESDDNSLHIKGINTKEGEELFRVQGDRIKNIGIKFKNKNVD